MSNPDSSLVDDALIAALLNDSQLRSLCPDGVWTDQAGEGKLRFVIISLADHEDAPVFGGRGFENALYLVKAVIKNGTGDIKAAALRIDEILSGADGRGAIINVNNFGQLSVAREARVRYTEVDEEEPSIRWLHRGGRYRVHASVA